MVAATAWILVVTLVADTARAAGTAAVTACTNWGDAVAVRSTPLVVATELTTLTNWAGGSPLATSASETAISREETWLSMALLAEVESPVVAAAVSSVADKPATGLTPSHAAGIKAATGLALITVAPVVT